MQARVRYTLRNTLKRLLREQSEEFLTRDKLPQCVYDNLYKKGRFVSMIVITGDGKKKPFEVSNRNIRLRVSSYQHSDKEKTDKQKYANKTHNLISVVDLNKYIEAIKATGDKKKASNTAYRKFKLENVIGFICNGKFEDMREINQIRSRFGDDFYNSLSKKAKALIADAKQNLEDVEDEVETEEQAVDSKNAVKEAFKRLRTKLNLII